MFKSLLECLTLPISISYFSSKMMTEVTEQPAPSSVITKLTHSSRRAPSSSCDECARAASCRSCPCVLTSLTSPTPCGLSGASLCRKPSLPLRLIGSGAGLNVPGGARPTLGGLTPRVKEVASSHRQEAGKTSPKLIYSANSLGRRALCAEYSCSPGLGAEGEAR